MNEVCSLRDLCGEFDIYGLNVIVYLVLGEACLIKSLGFPNFPGGLYGISLLCCLVVFFLCRFFVPHF